MEQPMSMESTRENAPLRSRGSIRIKVIIASLCLAQFLAALDVTIVATALPTIASSLGATTSSYTWVGSSYALASTSSTPVWAKCAEVFGRKLILMLANAVFLAGSLIAGLSQSIGMLIAGRAIQGIGAGGIMILCSIIIGDMFALRERAKYYGLMAIVWSVASGAGPLLGGVFTEALSWRWCFFINLPMDAISLVVLFFSLRLDVPKVSLVQAARTLDIVGLTTVVGGSICFLYGLESGASKSHAWSSAFTICLLASGVVLIATFLLYEWKLAKHPAVPIRVLKGRSSLASLATGFFNSFAFISYDFFIPVYLQVVRVAAVTGIFIKRTGMHKLAIHIGTVLMTLGTGLFIDFGSQTERWKIIVYQIIAGVGSGSLIAAPMIALQNHLQQKDVAAGVSAFTFIRNMASAMSIVVGGVVLQTGLGGDVSIVRDQNGAHKELYAKALRTMWIFYTAVCGLTLLSSLFISGKRIEEDEDTANVSGTEKAAGLTLKAWKVFQESNRT